MYVHTPDMHHGDLHIADVSNFPIRTAIKKREQIGVNQSALFLAKGQMEGALMSLLQIFWAGPCCGEPLRANRLVCLRVEADKESR